MPLRGTDLTVVGLHRKLAKHERDDLDRFAAIDKTLAQIRGQMYVLILVVAGSGLGNFFGHN